jgi:predicted GTPase
MFPGEDNPLWRFSVPEFLTFVKRVSDTLDLVVRENIPHGNSVTLGQAMAIYQWRSVIGVTEAAYDIWHLIQATKPTTPGAPDPREEATREIQDWERNELGRRFASAYVRAVGRAAIDLYSGRLRPLSDAAAATGTKVTEDGQAVPQEKVKPLRILVGGQVAAGKSSLISALLRQIKASVVSAPTKGLRAYELKREGISEALLIDTPGIEADDVAIEILKTQALHCDLLIWVTSAMSRDRARDRRVLDALRVAIRGERRYPPILGVHTHVDQLQPILDWSPPYNLDRAESPKAQAIGKDLLAVASDLRLPIQSVLPVCLDQTRGHYNIDILWARMLDLLTEGQSARLSHALAVPGDDGYWKRLWVQATVTGRVMTRSLPSQKAEPGSSRRLS